MQAGQPRASLPPKAASIIRFVRLLNTACDGGSFTFRIPPSLLGAYNLSFTYIF